MGLRIQNNISAVTALRNLRVNDRNQQQSLERLSTGFRINRASDDPSGLVISELLRAQIRGLSQAVENSENASNLIGTAEAALNETAALLTGLKESAIFAISTGSSTPEQIAAEQASVDSTLAAIDRIANTTRFGDRQLLNGAAQVQVVSGATAFDRVEIHSLQFGNLTSQNLDINVTAVASQAFIGQFPFTATAGGSGSITFRVTGSLGTAELTVASGASTAEIRDAVNKLTDNTGVVFGFPLGPTHDGFRSVEFGSSETVRVDVVSGTLNTGLGTISAGESRFARGSDAQATINGSKMTGNGLELSIANTAITAQFRLDQLADTVGLRTLRTLESGLEFQLNQSPSLSDAVTLGIGNLTASALGEDAREIVLFNDGNAPVDSNGFLITGAGEKRFGFLSSLRSGGDNDLFANPRNALRIVDAAIDQVSRQRAFMGGLQAYTIDSNVNSLEIAIENLTATESSIRDLDFAGETANFTRTQILFQASTAVLGNANLIPQSVLTLLQ